MEEVKRAPIDSQKDSCVPRCPLGATSRSKHPSHTPLSRTQKRNKHGLATPKKTGSRWGGAKTCYSLPMTSFRIWSTRTHYIHRTCVELSRPFTNGFSVAPRRCTGSKKTPPTSRDRATSAATGTKPKLSAHICLPTRPKHHLQATGDRSGRNETSKPYSTSSKTHVM